MFPSDSATWFSEEPLQGYRQAYSVHEELFSGSSEFQSVRILETDLLGRTLLLDNTIQTSTLDEFSYHEALVHTTLASVRSPERGADHRWR